MSNLSNYIFFIFLLSLTSCTDNKTIKNDAKEHFAIKKGIADKQSKALADKVMTAMGGQKKWDNTNYMSWTFFGSRKLIWDKKDSRVRIENPRDTSLYLVDLQTQKGKYFKNGKEITDTSVVNKKMKQAKGIWINDSYWLVMPFKLRDPGVNLKYVREDTITKGQSASVLELTFNDVGNTPDNKYEVYVDHKDNLIKKWSFFKSASQTDPPRSWPWDNYKDFNGLLLSTDRSDKSGPSEVKVYDVLEDSLFNEF